MRDNGAVTLDRIICRYHAPMHIIGHGVDIVEIKRIEAMLREHGERFIERCFTDAERGYAQSGGDESRRTAERFAVRFACKEAAFKAIGTGWRSGISWRDAEVLRDPMGKPRLIITGRAAEIAESMGITIWHVSLSHTDTMAMASVIACNR